MSISIYNADINGNVKGISHQYAEGQGTVTLQMSDNAISLSAFSSTGQDAKSRIQTVSLGANVLSVLDSSFSGCQNLASVGFGPNIKHIGAMAFKDCTQLQILSFPASLSFIGDEAFCNCSTASTISFPAHALVLGNSAFQGASSVLKVDVLLENGSGTAIFKNAMSLTSFSMSGTMTESICEGCTSLKYANVNSSTIPYRSFYGCTALTAVNFKQTVTAIGPEAFAKCSALSSISLSSTTINAVHRDFINGTAITSIVLPSTIDDLSKLDQNAFRGSKLTQVQFLGLSDKYVSDNMAKFGRFGASQNITYVSKDGVESSLKLDGNGLKSTSLYVISIGVDHSDRPSVNTLRGIHKDVDRLYKIVQEAYQDNMNQVVFRKIGQGGTGLEPSTYETVESCFADAQSKNPDLLVFHFSDHGSNQESNDYVKGSTTKHQKGYIMLTDYNMAYTTLFEQFKKFKRVFAIFCCCHPWYDVSSSSDGFSTKILVWAGGTKDQLTYYDPGKGHRFMTAICDTFDKSAAYKQAWTNGSYSNKWTYTEDNIKVIPQKYVYNNFDESTRMFTYGKEVNASPITIKPNDEQRSDDIKLISFQSTTTTSKDAGSESIGLGSNVVFAQNRQEYSDILTNLQKSASRFYGWNSHYNAGSNLKEIVNTPNGRGDALDLAVDSMEKNCRPLFLIYVKAYNKGSNAFNKTFYAWSRAFPTALGTMSKCQTTAFDSSKTEYGFYFLHYQNNADETDANANRAKAFITQFGQITTGYPWYIAYYKYPDGHVYARYGSLYSVNKSISSQDYDIITSIYTKWGDAVKEFGKEIQYAYTGLESSINSEQ